MTTATLHKSRWGFHPVSFEDYCFLKKLHAEYFEAVRQAAKWCRWANKAPHNRYGSEPKLISTFGMTNEELLESFRANLDRVAQWNPGWAEKQDRDNPQFNRAWQEIIDDKYKTLTQDYRSARTPIANPQEVKAVDMEKYRA